MNNPSVNPSLDPSAFDPSPENASIYSKVLEVIRLLQKSNRRIVLAESCTGGSVASLFASIPGVSEVFCGSMVVYRNDTKSQWLGVDPELLANPQIGPVSARASAELAKRVLDRTPEAHLALSITGHFGPNAPEELNLHVYMGWCEAEGLDRQVSQVLVQQGVLKPVPPISAFESADSSEEMQTRVAMHKRVGFQAQAVEMLMDFALARLKNMKTDKIGRYF